MARATTAVWSSEKTAEMPTKRVCACSVSRSILVIVKPFPALYSTSLTLIGLVEAGRGFGVAARSERGYRCRAGSAHEVLVNGREVTARQCWGV